MLVARVWPTIPCMVWCNQSWLHTLLSVDADSDDGAALLLSTTWHATHKKGVRVRVRATRSRGWCRLGPRRALFPQEDFLF